MLESFSLLSPITLFFVQFTDKRFIVGLQYSIICMYCCRMTDPGFNDPDELGILFSKSKEKANNKAGKETKQERKELQKS